MQTSFKVGEKVRVRGQAPVGKVSKVGDMIGVEYEHRPGTVTFGLYPPAHLELVGGSREPESGLPRIEGSEVRDAATKPKATIKDILPATK